ncbi:hypothetical protein [Nostoc mirabile]|uniref:hypothetical protein n=1 Tax=Nostoc mirabile TaxID=2907820 RepID=UPI0027E016AF|nr:hypothetical protein [Nostoc mirabile]
MRTGIETNFAKSFLLAASLVQDFSKPLIIVANAGDENTVFSNLYDAATKTKIYREWSRDLDWATIIRDIQILLGGMNTQRSLNVHLVEAMIGMPQGWTEN